MKKLTTLIIIASSLILTTAGFGLSIKNLNEDMTTRVVLDRYFYGQTPVDIVGFAGEVDGQMKYAIVQIAQTNPIIALTYAYEEEDNEEEDKIMLAHLNTETGEWQYKEASPSNADLIRRLIKDFRSLINEKE
jgi:hypothetical protein